MKKIKLLKLTLISILLFGSWNSEVNAAATGVYSVVGRMNDPFLFCTQGVPLDNWVAVNPILGTWTATSQYVNYQWIATYEAICPAAMKQGIWMGPGMGYAIGVPGTTILTPFPH
jgi:hypothetical protein